MRAIAGAGIELLVATGLLLAGLTTMQASADAATTGTWTYNVGAANSCYDIFGAEVTGFSVTAQASGNGKKVNAVGAVQTHSYTAAFWSLTNHASSVTWNASHSEAFVNATATFTLTYNTLILNLKETEQYQITVAIPANGNWYIQTDSANCISGLTFS